MTDSSPIRIVLADDHAMVREALARILEEDGQVTVVAQANDGDQALRAVSQFDPQVIVLDYSMPGRDAPQVFDQLLQIRPELKILVLTVHENIHYAVRVLEAGAHGYVIKSSAVDQLVEAIKAVFQGRIYLSASISQEVLQYLRRPKRERVGLEALSQREFDFLRSFGGGKSLQDCAKEMNISTSTASTYRARILEKLHLQNTAELIRFALEHNIAS